MAGSRPITSGKVTDHGPAERRDRRNARAAGPAFGPMPRRQISTISSLLRPATTVGWAWSIDHREWRCSGHLGDRGCAGLAGRDQAGRLSSSGLAASLDLRLTAGRRPSTRCVAEPVTKVDLTDVPPGPPTTLHCHRDTSGDFTAEPVKWEVKDGVGMINLNRFTGTERRPGPPSAWPTSTRRPPVRRIGYVLDLRSNGGGVARRGGRRCRPVPDRGQIVSQRGQRPIRSSVLMPGAAMLPAASRYRPGRRRLRFGQRDRRRRAPDHRRALSSVSAASARAGSSRSTSSARAALRLTTDLYYLPWAVGAGRRDHSRHRRAAAVGSRLCDPRPGS